MLSFFRARAILSLAPLLCSPWPASAASELRVLSASPVGTIEGGKADRIQILFDRAVAPLAAPSPGGEPPEWLRVEPPMLARWRWAGTSALVGEPLSRLPRSTTWRVAVARGARAMDGSTLASDHVFSFTTPRPQAVLTLEPPAGVELQEFVRYWARPDVVAAETPLVVVWDQPVDDGSFAARLSVRARPRPLPGAADLLPKVERERLAREDPEAFAAWQRFLDDSAGRPEFEVPIAVEPDPAHEHRVFRIRPTGPWPPSARLEVLVRAGVRALEGTEPTPADFRSFLETPWPFAPLRIDGRPSPGAGGSIDPESAGIVFTSGVRWQDVGASLRWRRDGEKEWRTVAPRPDEWWWTASSTRLPLAPLGAAGGAAYEVCLAKGIADDSGRSLGFPWCGRFRTARRPARFSLVERDGVVEWEGSHVLPLATTNITRYRLVQRLVPEEEIVGLVRSRRSDPALRPGPPPVTPPISAPADRRFVSAVELDPVLGGKPGIVWTSVEPAEVAPGSEYDDQEKTQLRRPLTAVTQVTSLGLTVKTSRREGVLAWVTRLRDGAPVEGAVVRVRDADNRVAWEGTTDRSGLARSPAELGTKPPVVVTARLGDDVAYAATNWHEGHRGWEFNLPVDWRDRAPVAGAVWPDRGIVRPGETVRVKAVLREQADRGLRVPARRSAVLVVRDARGREVEAREVTLDEWGGAEIELAIPFGAPLGWWDVTAFPTRPKPDAEGLGAYDASGSFRVAEFRRPKFRVSVTPERARLVAGDPLAASVEGALLAGGHPSGASTRWSVRQSRAWIRPAGSKWEQFEFLPGGFWDEDEDSPERDRVVAQESGALDGRGRLEVRIPRLETLGKWPTRVEVEAEVQDVDRQTSAGRAEVVAMPGEFQLGVRRPGYFLRAGDGLDTQIVALGLDGAMAPPTTATISLVRRHWESVRRRDASGRYDFDSRAVDETIEERTVETGTAPVDLRLSLPAGGEYALFVRGRDGRGNPVEAATSFYVLGEGESPWRLDRANRIELVVEKPGYAAGDTARVLVKSPWARGTALVTLERAGVLEARVVELEGPMPVVEIPVVRDHVPNLFVSVVLIRGRIPAPADPEMADPGRPAYRIGYAEIVVPPEERRLAVRLEVGSEEYRPGTEAAATVRVAGSDGKPRRASVTLWAVDAGVLSLTGYRAPDLVSVFHGRRGLGVVTGESRSRLVGRRSYGTKGDRVGGGGGFVEGADQLRADFRALAVWRGDVETDAAGEGAIRFRLPDSLTTYRLMAVAIAGDEEFGGAEREFRVSKPLGLEPALPRFLRPGDRARAGVVARNRTKERQRVRVRASSVDPSLLRIAGDAEQIVSLEAGASAELRFEWIGVAPGEARLRFEAATQGRSPERDSMEVPIPVRAFAPTESVATFFSVSGRSEERIALPAEVFPDAGGLEVRVAPTALVGGGVASDYLVAYPHRCAEQIASRLLGVIASARLGPGFAPETVDGIARDRWIGETARSLLSFQQGGGGFAFWKDSVHPDAALSAHVAWALAEARRAGVEGNAEAIEAAAEFLSAVLRRDRWPWGEHDGWTTRVLAAFALERLGKGEPAYYQNLWESRGQGRPLWAKAVLGATMLASSRSDPRAAPLLQEVRNGLDVEARAAALREPEPEWGWRVFWSERRGSAAALLALLAADPSDPTNDRLARGLLDRLARGRDLATHDAAWMLQALSLYRERREGSGAVGEVAVRLGREPIVVAVFEGAGSPVARAHVPMADLRKRAGRDGELTLDAEIEGQGPIHVAATLSYAPRALDRPAVAQGMALRRRLVDGQGSEISAARAGERIAIEVELSSTQDLSFVAVEIPIPGGLEAIDPGLATTSRPTEPAPEAGGEIPDEWELEYFPGDGEYLPGFDHVELHDDRIVLYASWLPAGKHATRVRCRATTSGRFAVAPAHAHAMYAPELFSTTSASAFEVGR